MKNCYEMFYKAIPGAQKLAGKMHEPTSFKDTSELE